MACCKRVLAVLLISLLVVVVVFPDLVVSGQVDNCYCDCMINSCMIVPGNTIEVCDPACTEGCTQGGREVDKANNSYCGTQNPPPSKFAALQNPPPSNLNAAVATSSPVVGAPANTTSLTTSAAATRLPWMLSQGLKPHIIWWMAGLYLLLGIPNN